MTKYWIGALLSLALIVAVFRAGLGFLAMLGVPLFAWYMSRILVHGGFGIWHYARHTSKADWNGRHYELGGVRLRAEETDDELVFIEKDILAFIDNQGAKTVELFGPKERFLLTSCDEMALTQAGCERLLTKCPHRDAKKLMLFLQREAFFPHLKRHGKLSTRMGEGAASKPTPITTKPEERT